MHNKNQSWGACNFRYKSSCWQYSGTFYAGTPYFAQDHLNERLLSITHKEWVWIQPFDCVASVWFVALRNGNKHVVQSGLHLNLSTRLQYPPFATIIFHQQVYVTGQGSFLVAPSIWHLTVIRTQWRNVSYMYMCSCLNLDNQDMHAVGLSHTHCLTTIANFRLVENG